MARTDYNSQPVFLRVIDLADSAEFRMIDISSFLSSLVIIPFSTSGLGVE